ncbi:MAG: N-acetylmuramoyl-L-alanine amidase [Sphingobacteriaceae bacterium]|jgi:N-acetylmuramoyl-L-alanine amidase|nr:N-acetylmuramoyl-L-alanine amidase [Sphingobacteriaceae bacterium]
MKIIPSRRVAAGFAAVFFCSLLVSFTNNLQTDTYRIRTIVIDAGHGSDIRGAKGSHAREEVVTLQVALKLGKAIQDNMKDVKVIYTRTSDLSVPLYKRIDIANKAKADLFISIHCNSIVNNRSTTRGVETMVAGTARLGEQDLALRENADILLEKDYKKNYKQPIIDPEDMIVFNMMKQNLRLQSIRLATLIQDEYVKTGRINRGVKEQPLAVLQPAGMPAVLTEIGFISNPEEEDYISSEAGQTEIVNCLFNAIQAYKKQLEIQ